MSRYLGKRVALLTKHGKGKVIGPVLARHCEIRVEVTEAFDTDQLGTFTRDRPRELSALECAEYKARLACKLTGLPQGLGSEGSFGGGPLGALWPWHQELIVLVDLERSIRIVGRAEGPSFQQHQQCDDWSSLLDFYRRAGDGQALVIRPAHRDHPEIFKGIDSRAQLRQAYERCRPLGSIFAEFDLRAHHSPLRRERIALAAGELAAKLCSLCPSCRGPGYWVEKGERGLPCEDCGMPTEALAARIWRCPGCAYEYRESVEDCWAEVRLCQYCNP